MKYYVIVLGLVFNGMLVMSLCADICQIDSIEQAAPEFVQADKDTLVVFDIVHTLIFLNKKNGKYAPKPVEQKTLDYIADLQKRGIKTIALTKCESYKFEQRVSLLQMVGVDFSQSFKSPTITFKTFKLMNGHRPIFYKGILMSLEYSKGEVLGAFLDYMQLKNVKKVLFFDDTKLCIDQVAQEMEKRKIPYRAYWYHGAKKQKQ